MNIIPKAKKIIEDGEISISPEFTFEYNKKETE